MCRYLAVPLIEGAPERSAWIGNTFNKLFMCTNAIWFAFDTSADLSTSAAYCFLRHHIISRHRCMHNAVQNHVARRRTLVCAWLNSSPSLEMYRNTTRTAICARYTTIGEIPHDFLSATPGNRLACYQLYHSIICLISTIFQNRWVEINFVTRALKHICQLNRILTPMDEQAAESVLKLNLSMSMFPFNAMRALTYLVP